MRWRSPRSVLYFATKPLLNVAGPVPCSWKTSTIVPEYTFGRARLFVTRNWLLYRNVYWLPAWSVAVPGATDELVTVRWPRRLVVQVIDVSVPVPLIVVPGGSFEQFSDLISKVTGVVSIVRFVGFACAVAGSNSTTVATAAGTSRFNSNTPSVQDRKTATWASGWPDGTLDSGGRPGIGCLPPSHGCPGPLDRRAARSLQRHRSAASSCAP